MANPRRLGSLHAPTQISRSCFFRCLFSSMISYMQPLRHLRTELPDWVPKPDEIRKKIKPAHHSTNRIAAGLSYYLVVDEARHFENASKCWLGTLGAVVLNSLYQKQRQQW